MPTGHSRSIRDPAWHRRQQLRAHGAVCRVPRRTRAARWSRSPAAMPRAPPSWRAPRTSRKAYRRLARAGRGQGRRGGRHRDTLPSLQARIAMPRARARQAGVRRKADGQRSGARAPCCGRPKPSGVPTMIDFNFPAIMAWLRAKAMLDAGAIGRCATSRCIGTSRAAPCRCACATGKPTATTAAACWAISSAIASIISNGSCGPIAGLSARIVRPAGRCRRLETTVAMAMQFGPAPLVSLSMSCASYLGAGHRSNSSARTARWCCTIRAPDYMRGFELSATPAAGRRSIAYRVEDPIDAQYPDGRIAPVSRLANRFSMPSTSGAPAAPGFAEGYRVQQLLDTARRAQRTGRWIDVGPKCRRSARECAVLVTGGSGFIGSALVKALVKAGHACGCSTTIRAAPRAACRKSKATSSSSAATSAMPPRWRAPCVASRGASPRFRQWHRVFLQRIPSSCSMSASRA